MKKYKVEIYLAIGLTLLLAGAIFWFSKHEQDATLKIAVAGLTLSVAVITLVSNWLKKKRAIESGEPAEDEFMKMARLYAGSKAFVYSLLLWLAIFIFHDMFTKEEEMLGVGILGSALIYGICLWYYKTTANFNEE